MSPALLTLPPLSLYIHIPWCIKKCPYCDFNSHQNDGVLPEAQYVQALINDLEGDLDYVQNRKLKSIFIGGGTPSLFSADSFASLLENIQRLIPFENNIEITLEANPGTFEQQKFSDFRQTGINRLSIGIQSFQKSFLQQLGRIHDHKEALLAPEIARNAGFTNFNLDLMFGLPEQSVEQALFDMETAISCQPTHISWYQLTIEANTQYYRYPPELPHEDVIMSMQEQGKSLLTKHDFNQYEISAYSKTGRQAVHNLNYWQFGDYLGVGAGAHGKLTQLGNGSIIRTRKTRQPNHYLDANKAFLVEALNVKPEELPLEFMMNALRMCQGSDAATFEQRTGLAIQVINSRLLDAQKKGLLETQDIVPTSRGQQYLNDLLACFLE